MKCNNKLGAHLKQLFEGSVAVTKMWSFYYCITCILSEMSNGPARGWYFEMENHCRYDPLVPSLPRPSTGGSHRWARPWNSLEFTWLAEAISEKQWKLRLQVYDFRKKWPILWANPDFRVLNCWTASSSWFPRVKIIHDVFWHVPELCRPCCDDAVG